MIRSLTYKAVCLAICLFAVVRGQAQGVTGVKFQMRFDTTTCLFDCYLIVTEGSATTAAQRAQFNAQYSIVTPAGSFIEVDTSYMPLVGNQTYGGITPMQWTLTNHIYAPCVQPQNDFHSIIPVLSPASFYNDLNTGDTVRLFSLRVTPIPACADDIRIFKNGIDPSSSSPCMGSGDFNNGFTVGGPAQDYRGNLPQVYPPKPALDAEVSCGSGIHIDLTATTSSCQGPLSYQWSGPSTSTTNEDINIVSTSAAYHGNYTVTVTDAYGCSNTAVYYGENKPNAGVDNSTCAGGSILLDAVTPNTGVWVQDTNNGFGASLSSTSGGNATASFNAAASGDFNFIYNTVSCSDTVKITVATQEAGDPPAFEDCFSTAVVTLAAEGTGSWTLGAGSSGSVTISPLNSPTATLSGFTAPGTYFLNWNNGSCTDQVVVSVGNVCACPIDNNIINDPSITSYCGTASGILITGSTPNPGGGVYTWEYSTDGFSFITAPGSNSARNYTTGTLTEGTYYFRRKYETTSGIICEDISNSVLIVVTGKPAAPAIASNSPICEGDDLEITAEFVGGAFYNWSGPFGGSTDMNVYINEATISNAGTYTLIIDINGCQSDPTNINVVIKPKPQLPDITTNAPVCAGDTIHFSTPVVAGGTYSWFGPAFSPYSTDRTPFVANASTGVAGVYYLTVEKDGCISEPNNIDILVKGLPSLPQFITNSPVCEGDTLELTAQVVTNATYTWTGPVAVPSVQNPKLSPVTAAHAGRYLLQLTVDGCESDTFGLNVQLKAKPAKPVITVESPICEGDSLIFTSDLHTGVTYMWTTNASSTFTSSEQNPVRLNATPNMSGKYILKTLLDGCYSDTVQVNALVKPTPAIPVLTSNGPICAGDTLTLTATVADTNIVVAWVGVTTLDSIKIHSIENATVGMTGLYTAKSILNGCESGNDSLMVTVKPNPITPPMAYNGPLCAEDVIELTADTVANAAYAWSGPGGYTSNIQNPVINNATPAMSGKYYLQITLNGCISQKDSTDVLVKPRPVVPVNASNSPVCEEDDIKLTAATLAGATYAWTGPGGFISADQNPVIANAALTNAGNYILKVTVDGCTSHADTIAVTVKDKPNTPDITSNSPVCAEQNLQLNTTATGVSYAWTGPDGFTSNVQNPVITAATVAKTGEYVLVVEANGCKSDTTRYTATVKAKPIAPTLLSNSPVCENDEIQLSMVPVTGASYQWTGPNGFNSLVANPTITSAVLTDAGIYKGKVVVDGCTSDEAQLTVVVNDRPDAPTINHNSPVCEGELLTLSTPIVGGASYTWINPAGATQSGSSITINNAQLTDGGEYKLVIATNNCQSPETSVTITVKAKPVLPDVSSNSPICEGEDLIFTINNSVSGTYTWLNNNDVQFSTDANATVIAASPTNSGVYKVKVEVNGCESEWANENVTIKPTPNTPVLSYNGPICEGDNLVLTAPSLPGLVYVWQNVKGEVVGNNAVAIIPGALPVNSGTYTLNVDEAGCPATPATIDVVVNAKPQAPALVSNGPVCEGETLQFEGEVIAGANYIWTDALGTVLSNSSVYSISNSQPAHTGTYFLEVELNNCFSDRSNIDATVYAKPSLPNIQANTPLCEGETLVFSTDVIAGGLYNWTDPSGANISNASDFSIGGVLPSMAGNYGLVVTVNGCASDQALENITIFSKTPDPVISGDAELCEGENLILTTPDLPGASYEWKNPFGATVSISSELRIDNIQTSGAGRYTIIQTIDGCPSDEQFVDVIINEIPAKPVINNNSPICEGETLVLTVDNLAGYQLVWTGPSGNNLGNANDVTLSGAQPAHSGKYQVQASSKGCLSEVAETDVIVNAKPAQPAIITNSPVCEGEAILLQTSSIANGQYIWTNPQGNVMVNQNQHTLANASLSMGGNYTLSIEVNGCISDQTTTLVEVKPLPQKPNIIGNSPVCEGTDIIFSTDVVSGAVYSWTNAAGTELSTTNELILSNVSTTDEGNYSLVVSVDGCASEETDAQAVVKLNPILPIIIANTSICEGENLQLEVTNIQAGAQYTWRHPDGLQSQTGSIWTINNASINDAGTYEVIAIIDGCSSEKATATINVKANPVVDFVSDNTPLCDGGDLILSTGGTAGATFNWYFSNVQVGTGTTLTINDAGLANSGIYEVKASWNGCDSEVKQINSIITPNPATPIILISSPICEGEQAVFSTAVVSGATYFWYNVLNVEVSTTNSYTISNVSGADAGQYSLKLVVDGCESPLATTNLAVKPLPVLPVIDSNSPVCEGEELTFETSAVPGVTYVWTKSGVQVGTGASLVIPNGQLTDGGTYELVATLDGCSVGPVNTVANVKAKPAIPAINNNGPLCTGEDAILSTSAIADQYVWSGVNGFSGTGNQVTITGVDVAKAGDYQLYVVVDGCQSDVATTTLEINEKPSLPVIANNSPLCSGEDLVLSSNIYIGGIYTWYDPTGTILGGSDNLTLNNIQVSHQGNYAVEVVVNGCKSDKATTTVSVKATPAQPIVNSNSPVCVGEDIMLTTAAVSGATYGWSGPALFTSVFQNPQITSAQLVNGGIYTLLVTVDGCTSPAATVDVRVENCACPIDNNDVQQPATTFYCGNSGSILLTGSTPTPAGGSFRWEYSIDGSNFSGASGTNNQRDYQTPDLGVGLHYFRRVYYTTTGIICEESSNVLVVEVREKPILSAPSNNGPLCEGEDLQLQVAALAGSNYSWSGPGGFVSTLQNPVVNGVDLTDGGIYDVFATVNGCNSDAQTTLVEVKEKPALPQIISNSPICEGGDIELEVAAIAGATYEWTGPVTGLANQAKITITSATTAKQGSYGVRVLVNGCYSDLATTDVVVIKKEAAPTLQSNAPLCEGETLEISANAISNALYQWGGPKTIMDNSNAIQLSGVDLSFAGKYTLTVINNGCASLPAEIDVTIKQKPSQPQVSSNSPVCLGDPIELFATAQSGVIFDWNGPATFSSNVANPVIAVSVLANAGLYTLTTELNGCESDAVQIQVVVEDCGCPIDNNSLQAPSVTQFCGLSDKVVIVGSTPNPAGGTFIWEYSTDGSNFSAAPDFNTGKDYTTAILTEGLHYFRRKYAITGGYTCEKVTELVQIEVKAKPVNPVVNNNGPVCEGNTLVLQIVPVAGASYTWISPAGSNIGTGTTYTLNNAQISDAGNYGIQIEANGCKSDVSYTQVDVNIKPVITDIQNNGPLCEGGQIELTATATAGVSYEWTGPAFTSVIDNPVLANVTKAMEGNYTLVVKLNGCASDPASTTVAVINRPTKPIISSNNPVCEGDDVNLFTDAVSGATYEWKGPDGWVSGDQNPVRTNATQLMSGVYTAQLVVNGCQSEIAQIEVRVENCNCPIDNNTITDPSISAFCEGQVSQLLTGSDAVPNDGEYLWLYSNDNVIFKAAGGTNTNRDYLVSNLPVGDHYFRRQFTTTSGIVCTEVTNTLHLIVNPIPDAPIVSNNGPVCPGEDVEITASQISGATYQWQGPGGFVSNNSTVTLPKVDAADAGQYIILATVNGCQSAPANTTVALKDVPEALNINSNGIACWGENIELSVDEIIGATYYWTGPNGFVSNDQKPVITNISAADGGDYSVYLVVDGCQGEPASIKVNTKDCSCVINNNSVIMPGNNDFCEKVENIVLDGPPANPTGGQYEWQYSLNGGNFNQANGNSNMEDYTIVSLGEGNHAFRRIYSTVGQNACSDTSNWVEFLVRPNPAVANISVTGGTCEGETLNLTATSVPGALYSWTGPNQFSSNLQNPVIVSPETIASGTYTLVVQIPGCTAKQATEDVVVKPRPESPQIVDAITVCEGEDIEIAPTQLAGASYSWGGPNNYTSTGKDLLINGIGVNQAGSYNVVVNLNGCLSTAEIVDITVNAKPQPPVVQTNNTLCEGEELLFNSNATAGDNITWTGPNGWTSNVFNPSIPAVNVLQSGTYTAKITRKGCVSDDYNFDIVVNAKPAAPSISNNGPVCEGKELVLNATNIAGVTFLWTGPNGFTSNEQNPVINAIDSLGAGQYRLIVIKNGCESEVAAMDVEIKNCACYIEDNSISNQGPVLYCDVTDNLDLLGNEVLPEGGNYIWQYSTDSLAFSQAGGSSETMLYKTGKLGVGTHYFRRVYTLNEDFVCADTSNILAIRVVSNDPNSIQIGFDPEPACIGDTIQVVIQNQMNGVNYNWSVAENGMNLISANGRIALFTPDKAGEYDVQVRQNIEGCSESDPATVKLVVMARPFVSLGKDTTFCEKDGELVLEPGDIYTSYEWNDGSTDSSLRVSEKGSYSVTITDEFGCINSDEITIKSFCCKITYPNIFMVDLGGKNSEFQLVDDGCVIKSTLKVYDRWGNKVYESNEGLESWDGKFNGRYVEQGVYTFVFNYTALDEDENEFEEVIAGDVTVIRR